MTLDDQKTRRIGSGLLMGVALTLFCLSVYKNGLPGSGLTVVLGLYLTYYIVQFFVKLGLTLPFLFIVFWCIIMILEWNRYQELKSYDMNDYLFAMSSLSCALTGAVVYFENKKRW